MTDLEAIEVLTQAKERLFEHGWGRFNMEHRPDGEFCLEEAILGQRGEFLECRSTPTHRRAALYVNLAVDRAYDGDCHVYRWNDIQETAGPVFDAIDRAIEIAKEAPNPA